MSSTNKRADKIFLEEKAQRLLEENSDLTYEFIKDLLCAQEEVHAGKLETYVFEPE